MRHYCVTGKSILENNKFPKNKLLIFLAVARIKLKKINFIHANTIFHPTTFQCKNKMNNFHENKDSFEQNIKIYNTVNRLRSFLSSSHLLIWSSSNLVLLSSGHPVIRSSHHHVDVILTCPRTDGLTDNFRIYRPVSQTNTKTYFCVIFLLLQSII